MHYFATVAIALTIIFVSEHHCLFVTHPRPQRARHAQLANNFQGSGSVSFVDTACMSILLKRDTVLAVNCGTIGHVFVVTTRIVNNASGDGETYTTLNAGRPIDLHKEGLMLYKFGPLTTHSAATPAKLPPKGLNHPPPAGSKCVSYSYTTDDATGNVRVSYSAVFIAKPGTCGGNRNFYCIQVEDPQGEKTFVPVLVYCPRTVWNGHDDDGYHTNGYDDVHYDGDQWLFAGGLQKSVQGSGSSSRVTTYRMFYTPNFLDNL